MNKCLFVGRLTRDPDVRYTTGDNAICIARFSLAVDRKFKKDGEQSADFPSCIAFGKTGEFIEKYFKKGMKIGIEGRLQTGTYTNKDGVKVYTTDIVVEQCEFVESKAAADEKENAAAVAPPDEDGFMNIPDGLDDEGLPFN